ncbi:MAG: pseudouridine synthase [Pseudomonadota bacterium]
MSPLLRLNAALARLGVASRRSAEKFIREGRVQIAGKVVTELATRVDPFAQEISVDGVPLDRPRKKHSYLAFHKPKNVVTTLADPEGRPTVRDYFPPGARLFPVGRLDYDAEGLLLVTTDGSLAHRLMHPGFKAKRVYRVKVKGKPARDLLDRLRRGVRLEDGMCKPLEVHFEKATENNSWYVMAVAEGRNRLVKRLWERMGHPVLKLIRTEYAGIRLADLPVGKIRPLRPDEIERLKEEFHS